MWMDVDGEKLQVRTSWALSEGAYTGCYWVEHCETVTCVVCYVCVVLGGAERRQAHRL